MHAVETNREKKNLYFMSEENAYQNIVDNSDKSLFKWHLQVSLNLNVHIGSNACLIHCFFHVLLKT